MDAPWNVDTNTIWFFRCVATGKDGSASDAAGIIDYPTVVLRVTHLEKAYSPSSTRMSARNLFVRV